MQWMQNPFLRIFLHISFYLLSHYLGHKTTVRAIFDPVISPRNHIITAVKL